MTHAPETGALNRLHFFSAGASFWSAMPIWAYVCHANLGPDSSGTRFRSRLEHCSIPSQKVVCTRLKYCTKVYNKHTARCINWYFYWLSNGMHFESLIRLFSEPENFIPEAYHMARKTGSENRYPNLLQKYSRVLHHNKTLILWSMHWSEVHIDFLWLQCLYKVI